MYKGLFNMLIEAYILCSFTYYICFKKYYPLDEKKKGLVRLKKKENHIIPIFYIF